MNCKIFLGMSGGVDSSVSAFLLKEAGYDVEGVMLLLKPDFELRKKEIDDAEKAAKRADIPFHTVDKTELFKNTVMSNFISEYTKGRTPNPCILCNPTVKFASLYEFAKQNGADLIATGHYADIYTDNRGIKHIKKNPTKKDQSYFLSRLTHEQVQSAVFPLGNISKADVRNIAKDLKLDCADKGDSQEVCFIPNNSYADFLTDFGGLVPTPGNYIDINGNILGKHKGIINYTMGQRRGLEIALGERMYVTKIDPEQNTVMLCKENERYIKELLVKNLTLINNSIPEGEFTAEVKIRSTARAQTAVITPPNNTDGTRRVILSQPQTMAAPGQTCAFYNGDILLGAAEIIM